MVLLDLLAQTFDLAGVGVAVAQFPLNDPHLFPQKKVALVFGERTDDIALDFRTQIQDFEFVIEQRQQTGQPFFDGDGFQQFLTLLQTQVKVGGDQIRQVSGVFGVQRGDFDLVRQGRRKFADFLKLLLGIANQCGQFNGFFCDILQHLDPPAQVRRLRFILLDANPPQPLDQHPHCVVGKLEHL